MLVLSPKAQQRIVIEENIYLVVVAGRHVTLGFIAPSDVPLHREEVRQRIASEGPVDDRLTAATTAVAIATTMSADLRAYPESRVQAVSWEAKCPTEVAASTS